MDSCTRENENWYLFAYIESLASYNVFSKAVVSLIPIGRTYDDIDQEFRRTPHRLKSTDVATLSDFR